ncbi:MAG: succinate dehydrogenase, hydrophobic membrane anchor protein [Rhizobiaceae bacterium]
MMTPDNDMHTPLSRVRGLGSAKDGTEHFWRQRLTAIALIPLILFFVWTLIILNGASHAEVVAHLSKPWVAITMLMVMGAGIYHMKLGMQVVIEDYVHGASGKALLIANTFFAIIMAAVSIFAILKLGFGG